MPSKTGRGGFEAGGEDGASGETGLEDGTESDGTQQVGYKGIGHGDSNNLQGSLTTAGIEKGRRRGRRISLFIL
jgi:hypothetical protein